MRGRRWRWAALAAVALLGCGGASVDPTSAEESTAPESQAEEASSEEGGGERSSVAEPAEAQAEEPPPAEPLPLLARQPPPPPLPAPGCHRLDADGLPGAAVTDLRFAASFAAGRRRFHVGELIRVALTFSAAREGVYELDAGVYDRAGRLHSDRYALSAEGGGPAEGVVDPLADYFDRGQIDMGGLRQIPPLGPTPQVIERDLNEYLRIDRPGRYRLRVASVRVSARSAQFACASPELELEILPPDEAAARRTLAGALAVLEPAARPGARARDEGAARQAARALRFLPTEASARAMVRLLARGDIEETWGELTFGLIGSPHRRAIVEAMEEALVRPDALIHVSFLSTLVRLARHLERPGYLPPWPTEPAEGVDLPTLQRRWRATEAAYQAHRQEVEDRYAARLARSLAQKTPAASDRGFATLLELALSREAAPPWMAELRPQIGRRLATMEADAQSRFLSDRWRQVADPALAEPLAQLVEAESTPVDTRALALARLLEIAPERARPRMEAEIRQVPLRLGYRARELLVLPFGPIPALDEALAAGIERNDYEQDMRAHLLARHGSAAILPRVRAALARRQEQGSAAGEGALLAYLLRVDRDRARAEVAARVQAARSALERTRLASQLAAAGAYLWDESLERGLIALLAAEEEGTVSHAAGALREHASAAAEAPLFARMRAHHERYRARPEEADQGEPWQIEEALVRALLRGRGWHLSSEALGRLEGLCLSRNGRESVGSARRASEGAAITIFLQASGSISAHVGRYSFDSEAEPLAPLTPGALRRFVIAGEDPPPLEGGRRVRAQALDDLDLKLAQLPRGAPVSITLLPDQGAETAALRATLERRLRAHGLRLVAPPSAR